MVLNINTTAAPSIVTASFLFPQSSHSLALAHNQNTRLSLTHFQSPHKAHSTSAKATLTLSLCLLLNALATMINLWFLVESQYEGDHEGARYPVTPGHAMGHWSIVYTQGSGFVEVESIAMRSPREDMKRVLCGSRN